MFTIAFGIVLGFLLIITLPLWFVFLMRLIAGLLVLGVGVVLAAAALLFG
jgi:hypothetical protein